MTDAFAQVVADLAAEHAALEQVLEQLPDEAWSLDTHAPGWKVRHQVAHLRIFDEAAVLAMNDEAAFRSRRISEPAYLREADSMSPSRLLAAWRTASRALVERAEALDRSTRLPWYGPGMSATSFVTARLMECWSHGLDIVDVVDIDRPDTDRLRHVAFIGYQARRFSYTNRGLEAPAKPVAVVLASPSGEAWRFGEENAADRISGTAADFCRVVTQRRHLDDTSLRVEGDAAREWMEIAQAFAGPPGRGRQPGEFR
jgi:uncharacterized protein (TIGR03084 family)